MEVGWRECLHGGRMEGMSIGGGGGGQDGGVSTWGQDGGNIYMGAGWMVCLHGGRMEGVTTWG